MPDTCLARQPIVDLRREVHAYELLFREFVGDTRCSSADGDQASAALMLRALMEIGIERVSSGRLAFINCTERILFLDGIEEMIPPKSAVLEVLESIDASPRVIERVRQLAGMGFRIALDDFSYAPALDPLLDLADYVKIDVQALTPEEVRRHVALRGSRRFALIAEKVETYDEFRRCQDLGFDYFQGWFFCKPETLQGRVPPANRLAAVQVVAKLHEQDVAIDDVVRLVNLDAALSYCVLRLANASLHARPIPIESVRDGVMRLGIAGLRRWLAVIMMAGLDQKPRELLVTGIIRARSCEVVGKERGGDSAPNPEALFTLGLFSVLDALFDCPLSDVLSRIPLAAPLKDALLNGAGPKGRILADVIAFERGQDARFDPVLARSWLAALGWADTMLAGLGLAERGTPAPPRRPQPV